MIYEASKYRNILILLLNSFLLGSIFSLNLARAEIRVVWQAGDSSGAIQEAINSGDTRIVIPMVSKPWLIARGLQARRANQTIYLEKGVELLAAEGAFKTLYESLFTFYADNITLSGYGATFRMRKKEYQNSSLYAASEWRHTINVRGARNFIIEGLTLKESGGDGILVGHGESEENQIPERRYSSGIIRDVVAISNHRQGISIVSAKDLLVQNSIFRDTSGTLPESGVDIEPDHPWQVISGIKFKDCQFINNAGSGIQLWMGFYHGDGLTDIAVSFERSKVLSNKENGVLVQDANVKQLKTAPGLIAFTDTFIDGTGKDGVLITQNEPNLVNAYNLSFENTILKNSLQASQYSGSVVLYSSEKAGGIGNINFGKSFVVQDKAGQPAFVVSQFSKSHGLANIGGLITINRASEAAPDLGNNLSNVTLKFKWDSSVIVTPTPARTVVPLATVAVRPTTVPIATVVSPTVTPQAEPSATKIPIGTPAIVRTPLVESTPTVKRPFKIRKSDVSFKIQRSGTKIYINTKHRGYKGCTMKVYGADLEENKEVDILMTQQVIAQSILLGTIEQSKHGATSRLELSNSHKIVEGSANRSFLMSVNYSCNEGSAEVTKRVSLAYVNESKGRQKKNLVEVATVREWLEKLLNNLI
jgi:hypothetical protein